MCLTFTSFSWETKWLSFEAIAQKFTTQLNFLKATTTTKDSTIIFLYILWFLCWNQMPQIWPTREKLKMEKLAGETMMRGAQKGSPEAQPVGA